MSNTWCIAIEDDAERLENREKDTRGNRVNTLQSLFSNGRDAQSGKICRRFKAFSRSKPGWFARENNAETAVKVPALGVLEI